MSFPTLAVPQGTLELAEVYAVNVEIKSEELQEAKRKLLTVEYPYRARGWLTHEHRKGKGNNMISLIISLFSVAIITSSPFSPDSASKKFLNQVLSDYGRHSLFVACNINSPSYCGKVVVENADLYAYLKHQNGFSKRRYKSYMHQKLSTEGKIEIKSEDLLKWKFFKVNEIAEVNNQILVGDENFIRNFFTEKVIKEGIGFDVRNAIIYELFGRQIGSKTDDETGYLYIPSVPE